ncbi:hypothetical protein K1719_024070 [Acacia pycnantha]|nr:hypothetical protein K1719_024070 [Acacia pycnantha]
MTMILVQFKKPTRSPEAAAEQSTSNEQAESEPKAEESQRLDSLSYFRRSFLPFVSPFNFWYEVHRVSEDLCLVQPDPFMSEIDHLQNQLKGVQKHA